MKKIYFIAALLLVAVISPARAWDLQEALKGLGGGDGSSTSKAIGSALGNLLSTDKITVAQMQGTWSYSAPAVTFKSDNVLKKAGGAAASTAITEKLAPIYAKTGFDKSQLTINADSTFQLKANKLTLKGTISAAPEGSQANFIFNFKVGGKMNVGKVETYVVKSATGSMSVMFDVTKLISLMETAGNLTGNSTIKSAVKMLKSYDGLCAGFEMKKAG